MTDYRHLGFMIYKLLNKCWALQEAKKPHSLLCPTDEEIVDALGFCLEIYNMKIEGKFTTVKSRESKP